MKTRTFTVLITETYEFDDPTDAMAIAEMRDAIQQSFDEGTMIGENFLIVGVEDGDKRFWSEWAQRMSTALGKGT